jgi:hypothetical protein
MNETSLAAEVAEIKKITEENNRLLKTMRRDALVGRVLQIVFWIVILVSSYHFTMQFMGPYLSALEGMRGENPSDIGALIDQYRAILGE